MLIYPKIDPVALEIGPLAVRWYGLMYLLAFLQFWGLGRRRLATHPKFVRDKWTVAELDDLLFYGVLGVVVGGRLGQVLYPWYDQDIKNGRTTDEEVMEILELMRVKFTAIDLFVSTASSSVGTPFRFSPTC